MRRLFPLLVACAAAVALVVGAGARPADAHNKLVSSDPADGAELPVAPPEITWQFDKPVPLDTMSVTLIDSTGVRTELEGSYHGPEGEAQVRTPLPATLSGEVSLRWRLVGADGHVVTGRVALVITGGSVPTTQVAAAPGASAAPPTSAAPVDEPDQYADDTGGSSTPSAVRWLLRYGSYAAIMTVVGVLFTAVWVWPGAAAHRLVVRLLSLALGATALLGLAQLLVLASDVSGDAPWAAWGALDAALSTTAGAALAVRVGFAIGLWIVLFPMRIRASEIYWPVAMLAAGVLLATWAYAGHARSQRWPQLGVLSDVAHHGAAAAWIGGLAIVGWIVLPRRIADEIVATLGRFSRIAAGCVAVLVVTGVAQSVRLVGGVGQLFDATHGRLLAAKLAVLAVMLVVADANRRRVRRILADPARVGPEHPTLRRSIATEFALGAVIVGITAALVVSPPATGAADAAPRPERSTYTT